MLENQGARRHAILPGTCSQEALHSDILKQKIVEFGLLLERDNKGITGDMRG